MTSSIDKYNYGFQVYTKFNKTLGIGINEGYTELLNHIIFNSKSIAYYHNVQIARLIETFFESENEMESAYFHSDIETLFQVFCKYGTKEEFFEIMNNLDNLAMTSIPIYNLATSIKTQLKLYNIIKRSKDKNKIQKFENILNKNPLIKFLISHPNIKLINRNVKTKR